jgi:hypothetical protein
MIKLHFILGSSVRGDARDAQNLTLALRTIGPLAARLMQIGSGQTPRPSLKRALRRNQHVGHLAMKCLSPRHPSGDALFVSE